jgi:hypothetical protein
MNIESFINYLIEKGFEDRQINQLIKIQEAGYNLVNYIDNDNNEEIKIIESEYIKITDDMDKLRELKNILINNKFTNSQLSEIIDGYKNNINYKAYAKKEYNGYQMFEFKRCLEEGLDVSICYENKYNFDQIQQVRFGLEEGVNILNYCDNTFKYGQMSEVRNGLFAGIDVTKYNNIKYNNEQMHMLKNILIYNKENPKSEIDVSLFQNEKIGYEKMNEFFYNLKYGDHNTKIKTYKRLNEYNELKNNLDR